MVDSKQGVSSPKQSSEVGAKISRLLQNQSILLVITLVILGLFFQWGSNGIFLGLGTLGTVLTDWGSYILLAVAQTFVVITGGIDLSVGSVVSLSSVIAEPSTPTTFSNNQQTQTSYNTKENTKTSKTIRK